MNVWEELAEFFYCNKTAERMECFMSNVPVLGE